jgi:Bifunctional DNA primase/polymerase, N-terminal/Primase C terminal 1 (PriCT-1)
VVLDEDNRDGINGSDHLEELAANCGGLPDTLTAITGNGKHLYFQHPGITVKNSTGQLARGVDVKADGGYVVAPPSLHKNGNRYCWEDPEQAVAALPDWLLAKITTRNEEEKNTTQAMELIPFIDSQIISEGSRDTTLFKFACELRGQQAKERDEIEAILLDYNEARCQPPMERADVRRIADSVCKYPAEMNTRKRDKQMEQRPTLPWFPFNTREWRADPNIMLMDDAQTGWCIRLIVCAWERRGYLPADMNKLWKLAGASSKKVFERRCELVLAAYEVVIMDGEYLLRHSMLADLYVTKEGVVAEKVKAAKNSVAQRAHLKAHRLIGTG